MIPDSLFSATLQRCAALTLILSGLLISGCGQRGPLYLPEPPAPITKPDGYDTRATAVKPNGQSENQSAKSAAAGQSR